MKRSLMALMMAVSLLSGCSALPGEDRSFVVALGLSEKGGIWAVSARLPTYQTGGGYMTLSARGKSLGEAMALLNASAPMELHYGQLRLLLFSEELAGSGAFPELLHALAARGEIRPQAALAVTADPVTEVMDALEPATGSRLSKSLETMITARERSGVVEVTTLDTWQRMGQRQQAVLICVALGSQTNDEPGMDTAAGDKAAEGAGKVQFSGGGMLSASGRANGRLTAMEMQLLSLLRGDMRQGTLALPEGTLTLLDADSHVELTGGEIHCCLKLRYGASVMTEEGVQMALINSLRRLTDRLGKAGCDPLGIARQAMMGKLSMDEWRGQNWTEIYPGMVWRFTVKAERET